MIQAAAAGAVAAYYTMRHAHDTLTTANGQGVVVAITCINVVGLLFVVWVIAQGFRDIRNRGRD